MASITIQEMQHYFNMLLGASSTVPKNAQHTLHAAEHWNKAIKEKVHLGQSLVFTPAMLMCNWQAVNSYMLYVAHI